MRVSTFGKPGTIGLEIRRRYWAWCGTCNNECSDVCPSKPYFEEVIKRMGWCKAGEKWYCSKACTESEKE